MKRQPILGMVTMLCLVSALAPVAAIAQVGPVALPPETDQNAGLADIVVTAQRREENLQNVPIAVSAFSADALRDRTIRTVQDLQNIAPALSFRSGSAASTAEIFIRGVGTADFNANNVGAVGVYVDDVFIGANSAKLFNVFDSRNIEVLRGPQGTLYGRNTTAGAIKFASHLPDDRPSGDLAASYGRFNDVRLEGGVGGPIVEDVLKVRVAGFYERSDGTTYNRFYDNRVNNLNIWGGRAIVDLTPTDTLLVRLIVHGGKNTGGARQFTHRGDNPDGTDLFGYADTDNDPWTGSYNVEGNERIKVFGASLKVAATMPWAVLTSITAYEKVDHTTLEDTDASPNDIVTAVYDDHPRQWSQELRLESRTGGAWNWALGGYYFHDKIASDSSFDLLRGLRDPTQPLDGFDPANSIGLLRYPFHQTTRSAAAFLQTDYRLTSRLKLTGGLRYTRDTINFDYDSFFDERGFIVPLVTSNQRRRFGNVSYRAAIDYTLSQRTLFYASVSSGYNSGGFSGAAATDLAQTTPYRSENLTAYEIGLKTEAFDRRLRFNAAAFYYDYSDLQVFVFDTSGPVPVQRKTNAGDARVYGAEAEITALPAHGLTLGFNASVLDTKYNRFATAGANFDGNRLINAPKLSGSASISYSHALSRVGTLNARADGSYQSRIFFTSANTAQYAQNAYALFNVRLSLDLPGDRWSVALWGKNLTSTRYLIDVSPVVTLDQLNYGDRATFGAEVRVKM